MSWGLQRNLECKPAHGGPLLFPPLALGIQAEEVEPRQGPSCYCFLPKPLVSNYLLDVPTHALGTIMPSFSFHLLALGSLPEGDGSLHPGACTAGTQGEPGNDPGL